MGQARVVVVVVGVVGQGRVWQKLAGSEHTLVDGGRGQHVGEHLGGWLVAGGVGGGVTLVSVELKKKS